MHISQALNLVLVLFLNLNKKSSFGLSTLKFVLFCYDV